MVNNSLLFGEKKKLMMKNKFSITSCYNNNAHTDTDGYKEDAKKQNGTNKKENNNISESDNYKNNNTIQNGVKGPHDNNNTSDNHKNSNRDSSSIQNGLNNSSSNNHNNHNDDDDGSNNVNDHNNDGSSNKDKTSCNIKTPIHHSNNNCENDERKTRQRSRTHSKRVINLGESFSENESKYQQQQQEKHKKRDVSEDNNSYTDDMSLDKDQLKEDLSKFTRRFLLYMLLAVSDMILGSLLFFYIEHCYHRIPPSYRPMEKTYIDICDLFETTQLYRQQQQSTNNNINTTTTPVAATTLTTGNDTSKFVEISRLCAERWEFEENIECLLTRDAFSKWFEYTASIGFTVGM